MKLININNQLRVDKAALNNYGDRHITSSSSYRTELRIAEELGEELTNIYTQLIVVPLWSICNYRD